MLSEESSKGKKEEKEKGGGRKEHCYLFWSRTALSIEFAKHRELRKERWWSPDTLEPPKQSFGLCPRRGGLSTTRIVGESAGELEDNDEDEHDHSNMVSLQQFAEFISHG